MMQYQAGVRTVVMGGLPQFGPMQAASGTRGAFPYTGDQLDTDFYDANSISNRSITDEIPELNADDARDTGMYVRSASFNLRDQVRTAGSDAQPLQFTYIAADCRLHYTLDNVLNMTRLWSDVARAAWMDSSLCVTNSTGYSTTGNITAEHAPPARDTTISALPDVEYTFSVNATYNSFDDGPKLASSSVKPCNSKSDCSHSYECLRVTYTCGSSRGILSQAQAVHKSKKICVNTCETTEGVCKDQKTFCDPSSPYKSEIKNTVRSGSSNSQKSQKSRKTASHLSICVPLDGQYFQDLCGSS